MVAPAPPASATIVRGRPEILAPAGDRAALEAAVRAGADAVYFGLQGFNARARATNFDAEGLAETLAWLHARGAKGYVTLNTLVFDAELEAVEAAIRACADAGADAIIVQDLGVLRLARAIAPDLPVHASTQMTCTDAASVELARELGARRVVLARELSLEDIAAIRQATDVELEVFVHGALCIAYSGQCLTSEAIGGRSANRGACAQACRLPYELVVDGVLQELGERAYLLSPEDLETSALVPALAELGVTSLKIEGRLKGEAYVAAATTLYRRAVDALAGGAVPPGEAERAAALQAYSRGSGTGFLAGVDHQRLVEGRACDHRGLPVGTLREVQAARGKAQLVLALDAPLARGDGVLVEGGRAGVGELGGRVWTMSVAGVDVARADAGAEAHVWLGPDRTVPPEARELAGRRVWKTSDPAAERAVLADNARAERRLTIDVTVRGALGELPVLEARARGVSHPPVLVTGDVALARAERTPLDAAMLREKLGRLGDTTFELGELIVAIPGDALVPVSSLNRARRALAAALTDALAQRHATREEDAVAIARAAAPPDRAPPPAGLFVTCRTLAQAEAALDAGADGVYLDFLELTGTGAALRALRARSPRVHVGVAPPRIRKPGEEKIDRYLDGLEPDSVLVRGLGALRESASSGAGAARVGDFSLNITNRVAAAEVLARGLAAFTPSFDLDGAQLAELVRAPFGPWAEVVVHHPMPLFHMEHCVIAALLSEGKDHRTCGRPCETKVVSLRDRAGMDHPVEADVGCRNTVFHAAPQSAASLVPGLRDAGVQRFRVELVREDAAEVRRVVGAYRALLDGGKDAAEVWRELRTSERGYGVVRGSLRVLG